MQTKPDKIPQPAGQQGRTAVQWLKGLLLKVGSIIKETDPFIRSLLLLGVFLLVAFFSKKTEIKWLSAILLWPTFLFPESRLLSLVFELIYAFYFIRVLRFVTIKLSYFVLIFADRDKRKQSAVNSAMLRSAFSGFLKSFGRGIINLPVLIWKVLKRIGIWLLSVPRGVWKGVKITGLWFASLPLKSWRAVKRTPRFLADELGGLGKEFLEMLKNFYRIRTLPGKRISLVLSLILFLLCIKIYYNTSVERHAENAQDKLVPTGAQLWNGFKKTIFTVNIKEDYDANGDIIQNDSPKNLREAVDRDKKAFAVGNYKNRLEMWKKGVTRSYLKQGESLLWIDTKASGRRILVAMMFIFAGIYVGLFMGAFPYAEKLLYRFVLFFDKVPALAVLPILFIVFGLGETAKIALIVIGVAPTIVLDTYLKVKEVHDEQVVKGMTLGASQPEIIFRIIFPQIIPKVLDTVRLNFKAVILFLIAGEALAAEAGIGYRIFVVRRYMDMATIFPYVVWISMLAFIVDMAFRTWIKRKYQWLNK